MMGVYVVFHHEPSYINAFSGTTGALEIFRESLKPLGITGLAIVNSFGLQPYIGDSQLDNHIFTSLDEALDFYKDHEKVYLEVFEKETGEIISTPLSKFEHPEDAIYVVGSDAFGLNLRNLLDKYQGTFVHIDSPTKMPTTSLAAASIVMWHRFFARK